MKTGKWLLLLFLLVVAAALLANKGTVSTPTDARTQGLAAPLSSGQPLPAPSNVGGSHSIVGKPTISARRIDALLAAYRSPTAGLGQYIYDAGLRYRIDPVHVLAIFLHESRMGTTGEATKTYSPGNERCIQDRPCIDPQLGGYAQMESWADGFLHLYMLLYYGYVQGQVTIPIVGHACVTVEQIVPVFAPSSDHNDVAAYISAWEVAVDAWRAGRTVI